jgi:hypothetical protein
VISTVFPASASLVRPLPSVDLLFQPYALILCLVAVALS